jgi:multidrug efflux system membrane fusion protein
MRRDHRPPQGFDTDNGVFRLAKEGVAVPRLSYILAIAIVLVVGGWFATGMLAQDDAPEVRQASTEPEAPLVEVMLSRATDVTRHVVVQGDVRPFRRASVRAETNGRVSEMLVNLGERVEAAQPIARLTLEGRGSRLREAQAVLRQRQEEYESAASLLEKGFTTQSRFRELETQLESARETVRQMEEELDNTTVTAPFSSVVDSLAVAEGEFVSANADIATLIDNSPLRVEVHVNQTNRAQIPSDGTAQVDFATGETQVGRICFISAAADPQTRTFRVEVRAPNADNLVPSGISAEVKIPTDRRAAHFVSPAIFSLGTDGTLGIKTVSDDHTVAFHPVEVVRAQTNGVWVSGLPQVARIITTGQGFVQEGDSVRASEAPNGSRGPARGLEAPASEPGEAAPSADICRLKPTTDGTVVGATAPEADAGPPATSTPPGDEGE